MKKSLISAAIISLFVIGFPASNLTSTDEPSTTTPDIPSDTQAQPNPELGGEPNASIPNIQYTTVDEDGSAVFRIDMTGIQDQSTLDWLRLLGTGEVGQNVWVEIDGQPKGVKVYNTADDNNERSVPVDLVFLVDNSGSMSEEANTIARDITTWAEKLSKTSLDIKFGCVGYDGAITGAVNITSYQNLSNYLNRDDAWGTGRTVGFDGSEADIMKFNSNKESYRTGGYSDAECGMAALRFATDMFTFRKDANRIFVNFTDEPNQPRGNANFSVESLKTDWNTNLGTIHTVFSEYQSYDRNESNRLMSEYTGGTVIYTNSSFTSVTLENLPVTDAMRNSYVIRISNIREFMDGQTHNVRITILSPDGTVRAERTFQVVLEAI
ncbi:MAG: VWA domain-containing protein [Bacteroides sp.]|nr:VWA domain-containing protein [Bacteroides sp.]MDE5828348.1 VWA domain-containing protein [Duncaniella sp.]